LSHSMADLVVAGRMSEAERRYEPKEPGRLGSKKDDHGLLPLAHPIVEKLSDPGHFVKSFESEQYVFVSAQKKQSDLQGGCNAAKSKHVVHAKTVQTRNRELLLGKVPKSCKGQLRTPLEQSPVLWHLVPSERLDR
jgi:hypothetical protein